MCLCSRINSNAAVDYCACAVSVAVPEAMEAVSKIKAWISDPNAQELSREISILLEYRDLSEDTLLNRRKGLALQLDPVWRRWFCRETDDRKWSSADRWLYGVFAAIADQERLIKTQKSAKGQGLNVCFCLFPEDGVDQPIVNLCAVSLSGIRH